MGMTSQCRRTIKFLAINGFVLLGLILSGAMVALAANSPTLADVDALLQSPTLDFQQALRARSLYEQMLAAPHSPIPPILLMRLARVEFILGDLAPNSLREKYYHQGLAVAERLIKEYPKRGEGYYWKGLHLCGLAETGGSGQGLRLLPQIIEELQLAVTLDETYDQAGAHRTLGRIYYEAPAWPMSVGDFNKSREHLARAVYLAPDNCTNHLYLAETLISLHQTAQARRELERVLTATQHAAQPQGLEEDRQKAHLLLQKLDEEE
jgi:tetratricopeptide (TPR) repeat protein